MPNWQAFPMKRRRNSFSTRSLVEWDAANELYRNDSSQDYNFRVAVSPHGPRKKALWTNMVLTLSGCSLLSKTKVPSRVEMSPSKERRRFKQKRTWNNLTKILPRLFIVFFLGRFSYDVYMLHSTTWSGDISFLPAGGNERRFLEHFYNNAMVGESRLSFDSRRVKEHTRVKRPPPIAQNYSLQADGTLVKLQRLSDTGTPSFVPKDWNLLCKGSGLNRSSRVLITDVIRQPVATLLALTVARHCNVRTIVGTDSLFPNVRMSRLRHMQIFKKLLQSIPTFRLVVTELGLRRPIDKAAPSWLWEFDPTHVLVSDHIPDDQSVDGTMSRQSHQLYKEKHNAQIWNDLFSSLSLRKSRKKFQNPRVVHLSTSFSLDFDRNRKTVNEHLPVLFGVLFRQNITRVVLPHLYGPGCPLLPRFHDPFQEKAEFPFTCDAPHMHVTEALMAIVSAFQIPRAGGYINFKVPQNLILSTEEVINARAGGSNLSQRVRESMAWIDYISHPFGETTSKPLLKSATSEPITQTDGIGSINHLPCASQCTTTHFKCEPSAFDDLVGISQSATSKCRFVVYMGNFSNALSSLPPFTDQKQQGLCRVAFVSENSKLLQDLYKEEEKEQTSLRDLNGKLTSQGWVLVWPSHDYEDFTVGDAALLRIDPSRLFSKRVQKALFAGSNSFAKISNGQAMQLLGFADARGHKDGQRSFHEHRSGTNLYRWVPLPKSKPRRSILFAGSLFPSSMGAVGPDILVNGKNYCKRQVEFYKQVAHRVHTNVGRPEFEIRSTLYKTFPFHWIAPFFLVHNLQMEQARVLRCEWLDEHLSWTKMNQVKGSAEELSLGFVLGRRKTMRLLGDSDPRDGKPGMMPLLTSGSEEETLVDDSGAEVYIGILDPRS